LNLDILTINRADLKRTLVKNKLTGKTNKNIRQHDKNYQTETIFRKTLFEVQLDFLVWLVSHSGLMTYTATSH